MQSATKSCTLDPIPTHVLKDHDSSLVPIITKMVNISMSSGTVPPSVKMALVTPLLKKSTLDPNILKNYRPVSNLPYLSKVLERIVLQRMLDYLNITNQQEPHRSAYRLLHSPETALLRVSNDILMALDQHKAAMLVLLSAAFDTIDHGMLLNRQSYIGIQDTVHDWLRSYLNSRCQSININGCKSQSIPLRYGVRQGSVLGPFLFTQYTVPIGAYVGNTVSAISYTPTIPRSTSRFTLVMMQIKKATLAKIEACVAEIRAWMVMHRLKLNDDKIEFVYLVSLNNTKSISIEPITIGDISIPPTSSARNIGVIFDRTFQMDGQVGKVCQAFYFWLRNIRCVSSHLTLTATRQIVQLLVISRLDYCNSLLQGLPKYQLARLQRIQNAAAMSSCMHPTP